MDFVEFRTLGLNAQTAGFLGTLLFTTLSFLAQIGQCQTLYARPERRGESVAPLFYAYCAGAYAIGLFYGIATGRLALMYNGGMLMPVYAVIAYGLWKFKRFGVAEWVALSAGTSGAVVMAFAHDASVRQAVFALSLTGFVAACAAPPWELWKRKRIGVLRIEPSLVAVVSTSFWVTYGLSTGDPVLRVASPLILTAVLATVVLWVRYGGDLRTTFRKRSV